MRQPLWWMFILSFFPHNSLYTQQENFRFHHLTTEDGLSQNLVNSIEQDSRGFLWIGTNDGLNRYDGYEFKVYNNIPGDSTSLTDNSVTAVFEDSPQNLWIGAGGLHLYDRKRDRFERLLTAGDLPGDQATPRVNQIREDTRGNIWFSVRNTGIFRLQLPEDELTEGQGQLLRGMYRLIGPYLLSPEKDPNEVVKIHQFIFIENSIWVTSDLDGARISRLRAGADGRFPDPDRSAFEPVKLDLPWENSRVSSLFQTPDKAVWVGTSHGLIRLADPEKTDEFSYYPYPEGSFSVHWEGIIKKIAMAPSGKLWLATYAGVMIFDPQTGIYQQIANHPYDPQSLSFDNISEVFVDRGRVIWLGTVGMGINKFISSSKSFRNYLGKPQNKETNSVYGILEGPEGKIWAIVNTGDLKRIDPATGYASTYLPDKNHDWNITSLAGDGKGILWMTENHMLVRLDPRSGQVNYFQIMPRPAISFPSDSISVVYLDRNDQVWLCNTRHLRQFEPSTGSFKKYPLPEDHYLERVEALHRDEEGGFWIATLQGLLHFRIDGGGWRLYQAAPGKKDSLQQNKVKCILPDPDDPERFLWIGTGGGGLHRFDKERETFLTITSKDGLANNFIYGILPDSSGRLWISTNQGLSRFSPETRKFINFKVEDGLQSNEFNSRAYYRSPSGKLFFGGINGITSFFPDQVGPNPHVPPVVITDMKLSYESILPGNTGGPLKYAVTETEEVLLDYHQHDIAFEFAAMDFTLPENNQYRYLLEGFDEHWIEAGPGRQATYTNLPPGRYTFRVQGANNDGVWNREGAAIKLFIARPPWLSWWAFMCYAFLLGLAGYGIYRYLAERRRMREELRFRELEAQKLAELDEFKSQFFADVSHEFRTPITLIQGHIEELLRLYNHNDLRERLFSMKRNTGQLLHLIEQLLDIARLKAKRMHLNREPGDLAAFLRMLTYSLQSGAEIKGVSLTFTTEEKQIFAAFDANALQKMVQNLISNAIKFTPSGGEVRVVVSTSNRQNLVEAGQADRVRIQVADTGAGIPETDLPRIFERFFQAGNAVSISEKGFGLGLSLVKEMVNLHQGELSVKSEIGRGTTVTIDLPIIAVPLNKERNASTREIDQRLVDLEAPGLESPGKAEVKGAPSGSQVLKQPFSKMILVVEDHSELCDFITVILQPEYKVIQARDGREGFEMALDRIPDLIISDVMMPKLDGYQLSKNLKSDQRTSHIPIVLLTARAEMQDRIRGLDLGVDDFLIKPFDEMELKVRVRNLLLKHEQLKKKYAQSLLSDSVAGTSHEEAFLKRVKDLIEKNIDDENFGVEVLAREIGMSASHLYRKLQALTDRSTVQLIQLFRLERSAELLRQGYNVTEAAFMVGLRSPAYFSQLFKKHFGCSPTEFAANEKIRNSS